MDRNKYLAVMLRMMAEGEARIGKQSKSLLAKHAKEGAKSFEASGTVTEIPNGIKDWHKLLTAHYALTIKKFSTYQFEALGFKKASFEQIASSFIALNALKHAIIINKTTIELITHVIQKGFDQGLGQNEIAKLIRESVGGTIAAHRARTIARTETHNAATYASQIAAEQADRPLIREWCSAEDSRTRPAHADVNGQQKEMNEPFEVGGELIQRPGEGSPENAINCRCVLLYIPKSIQESNDAN